MRFDNYLLTESINDKGIWKAVFLAGTPGAGKSFVKDKIGGGVEPRTVNSDTWTEFLKGGQAGQWDLFKDDVKRLTANQLALYINSMLPLWVDGTSSNPSNVVARKGMLEGFGYDTGMVWVNTDLETAKRRAEEREKRIGRHVDPKFIEETYEKINKLKPFYRSKFKNFFVEVDNNEGMLTDEVLTKLYKRADSFFKEPLHNDLGKMYKDELTENKGKYLEDLSNIDMPAIKQRLQGWFSY